MFRSDFYRCCYSNNCLLLLLLSVRKKLVFPFISLPLIYFRPSLSLQISFIFLFTSSLTFCHSLITCTSHVIVSIWTLNSNLIDQISIRSVMPLFFPIKFYRIIYKIFKYSKYTKNNNFQHMLSIYHITNLSYF